MGKSDRLINYISPKPRFRGMPHRLVTSQTLINSTSIWLPCNTRWLKLCWKLESPDKMFPLPLDPPILVLYDARQTSVWFTEAHGIYTEKKYWPWCRHVCVVIFKEGKRKHVYVATVCPWQTINYINYWELENFLHTHFAAVLKQLGSTSGRR